MMTKTTEDFPSFCSHVSTAPTILPYALAFTELVVSTPNLHYDFSKLTDFFFIIISLLFFVRKGKERRRRSPKKKIKIDTFGSMHCVMIRTLPHEVSQSSIIFLTGRR